MWKLCTQFVSLVDTLNYRVGRLAMLLLFVMMAVLLWSSLSKTLFFPSLWTLETAQFVMAAYYILGGPYSIQLGANVRMDLFYHRFSARRKAAFDCVTGLFLVFFIAVLLVGSLESLEYALRYNERNPTAWRPPLWPIKACMCIGFVLMLCQTIAEIIRDMATLIHKPLPPRRLYPGHQPLQSSITSQKSTK